MRHGWICNLSPQRKKNRKAKCEGYSHAIGNKSLVNGHFLNLEVRQHFTGGVFHLARQIRPTTCPRVGRANRVLSAIIITSQQSPLIM
jgi:hypothetical protein